MLASKPTATLRPLFTVRPDSPPQRQPASLPSPAPTATHEPSPLPSSLNAHLSKKSSSVMPRTADVVPIGQTDENNGAATSLAKKRAPLAGVVKAAPAVKRAPLSRTQSHVVLGEKSVQTGLSGKRTLGELFFDGKEPFAPSSPDSSTNNNKNRKLSSTSSLTRSTSQPKVLCNKLAPITIPSSKPTTSRKSTHRSDLSSMVKTKGILPPVDENVRPVPFNEFTFPDASVVLPPLSFDAVCPGAPRMGECSRFESFPNGDEVVHKSDKDNLCAIPVTPTWPSSPLAEVTEAYTGLQGAFRSSPVTSAFNLCNIDPLTWDDNTLLPSPLISRRSSQDSLVDRIVTQGMNNLTIEQPVRSVVLRSRKSRHHTSSTTSTPCLRI